MSIMRITKTGIRRRRSEIRYISFVTLIAVLFMSAVTLFQEIADAYVMESNYHNYGDWVISAVEERLSHPYFAGEGYAKTGPMVLSEDYSSGVYVGCVDGALAEFGRINLYEGHLPVEEQEIAMDLYSLARLGYSYELGQNIAIEFLDAEGAQQSREYELVGTFMSFAENWKHLGRYYLPNVLVAESELSGYGCEVYTTYFYPFDKSYERIDVKTFAESFIKPFTDRTFNSYVYENRVWGSSEIYDMATYVLMLISTLAISYLLMVYIGKRRGAYYQLRTMGASRRQIRCMICVEALYATLPQVGLGLVVPYIAGYLICLVLAMRNGMQNFFRVNFLLVGKQLVAVVLVLLIAVFFAQFSASDKRLAANTEEMRPFWYGYLRKWARRSKRPEQALLSRYEKTRPLQKGLSLLLTLLVCGGSIVCFDCITEAYDEYKWGTEAVPDFLMTKDINYNYPTVDGYVSGTMCYIFAGMDEVLREEISLVPGIESIQYLYRDDALYLDWKEKENSPMIKNLRLANQNGVEKQIGAVTRIYADFADIGELPEEVRGTVDEEKWQAGEQIIVLLQTKYDDWEAIWSDRGSSAFMTSEKLTIYDETLSPGETVLIRNLETELSYPVEVGAVCYITDHTDNTLSYRIVMSRTLGEKLAQQQGLELSPTTARLQFNSQASFEASEKRLAKIAEENGMYYTSYMEGKRIHYQRFLQKVGVYGCILTMLVSVYVILQRSFLNTTLRYRRDNYRILKQLGMEDEQYKRLSMREAVRNYIRLYAGMAAGYGMVYYLHWKKLSDKYAVKNTWTLSRLLEDYTQDVGLLSLEYILLDMKHVGVMALVTVLFVCMVCSYMQAVNKFMEESR